MPQDEDMAAAAAEPAEIGKVDLAKYRTGDLAERLVELLSVPAAFRKVLKTASVVAVLTLVACWLVGHQAEMSRIPLLVLCGYSLAVGVVFGFLLGVLRVIAGALGHLGAVLKTVLEITDKLATDYDRLQAGHTRLPSGGELVEQVYDGVLMPVMERSVAKAFGFLGTPLLWAYRRTIGPAVRLLIRRVNRAERTVTGEQKVTRGVQSGMAAISKYSERIKSYTSRASDIVSKIGGRIRFWAMLPMYVLFVICLALATVPIFVIRYFAGG